MARRLLAILGGVHRFAPQTAALLLLTMSTLSGCRPSGSASSSEPKAATQQREETNAIRAELETIPPPTKAKFSSIRSIDSWENPYLTIQDRFVVLHITNADPIPGGIGAGSFLRPTGARRQILTLHTAELAQALEAVPRSAWPYGRVVAIEEARSIPQAAEPDVRRTMEAVMRSLTDLGVVTYEWTESGPEIR